MKKSLFLFSCFFLLTAGLFAQAPDKMSCQSVVRDGSGNLLVNHNIGMRIQILQGSEFGAAVYVETHSARTNVNGLIDIVIGLGAGVHGSLADIHWSNGTYYIKTEIDPNNGTNYSVNGVGQFMSMPYAMHSKTAETLTQPVQYADLAGKPNFKDSVQAHGFNGDYNDLANRPNFKDSVAKHTGTYQLGDTLFGGVIFYLDESGKHGLVASPRDLGDSKWLPNDVAVGVGAKVPGYGMGIYNTIAILAHTTGFLHESAPGLCVEFNLNGHGWYLPNNMELDRLLKSRTRINNSLADIPGSQPVSLDTHYWSSTEGPGPGNGAIFMHVISLGSGTGIASSTSDRTAIKRVRPVRAF